MEKWKVYIKRELVGGVSPYKHLLLTCSLLLSPIYIYIYQYSMLCIVTIVDCTHTPLRPLSLVVVY